MVLVLGNTVYTTLVVQRLKLIVFVWLSAVFSASLSHSAYDDGARYAFTASPEKQAIYVIDLHMREQVDTISVDFTPDMISASESLKALIVTSRKAKQLVLIDLSSEQLSQHTYPLAISPDYINVSPIGTIAIYDRQKQILEVHAVKRQQLLLRAENVRSSEKFTFNLDGSMIYWADQEAGALRSIDLWSKEKALQLTAAKGSLTALSRSTDGLLGFISSRLDNNVYVVNLRDFSRLTTIKVGSNPGRPWGTSDGTIMLIANRGDSTITAISTSSLQRLYTVATVAKPIAINPGWLDSTAAILGEDGTVGFIDVAKGTGGKTYDLQGLPHEGIVTSDSKILAVPVAGKGTISFFDMRKRSLTSEISGLPNDIGPATLAVSNNLCH
jgi:DNA-binding beta-propeller fold protein YncE